MTDNRANERIEEEVRHLADRQCDNTITGEELGRLEQLLSDSPELRKQYLNCVRLNADLMWLYRTGDGAANLPALENSSDGAKNWLLSERQEISGESEKTVWRLQYRFLKFGLALTTLFLVALTGVWIGRSASMSERSQRDDESKLKSSSDEAPSKALPFIATLMRASNVVWSETGEAVDVGDRVSPGEIWLESGDAEWLFDSGAKLVLSGPSRMNLQSSLAAHLESGAIVAHMPESAIGFKLSTTAADFIDQGTEFGVVAEHGGPAEVHVFRGQVDVRTKNNVNAIEVFTKEAMRIESAAGAGKTIAFSKVPFGGLEQRVASPVHWAVDEGGNDHFYELVVLKKPIAWHEAAVDAMGRHHSGLPGHLVTVNSQSEDQFLVQTLIRESSARGVWIGLTDVLRESDFRWITGEPMEYANWATYPEQQPDNYLEADWHGGEDYGMYTTFPGKQPWAWNDLSVDSMHEKVSAYIVEYEPPIDALKDRSMVLEPICWETSDGGNGHHYQLVLSLESVDWETIRRRARNFSLGDSMGYLACLETEEERDFVVQQILRVSGIPENMIGLSSGPDSKLKWVTGKPLEGIEFGKPFLPTGQVYGLMFWDYKTGRWDMQTRSVEALPTGWFGYLVEYP